MLTQTDENTYQQPEYRQTFAHPSTITKQRQQLYPRTALGHVNIDSPGHVRSFGRPPSHGGQGVRSAAVSAAGRGPLDRLSSNVTMNENQSGGYRIGGAKSIGRPAYARR